MKKKFSARQEAFIRHYLTCLNGAQAAIKAGYGKSGAAVEAARLLRNAHIKKRIEELSKKTMSHLDATKERILTELVRIAFGDMKDLAVWEGKGVFLKKSSELSGDVSSTVQEVSETQSGIKIKKFDKIKALELLSRLGGFLSDENKETPVKMILYNYKPKHER